MAVPPHHFDDEPAENVPGGLLDELERRQDEVLDKLDDLDAQLSEVLKGLEPTPNSAGGEVIDQDGDVESGLVWGKRAAIAGDETPAEDEDRGASDSAENWA